MALLASMSSEVMVEQEAPRTLASASSSRRAPSARGSRPVSRRLAIAPTVLALHSTGQHPEAIRAIGRLVREQTLLHGRGAPEAVKVAAAASRLSNELALMSMQKGARGFSFQAAYDYLQHALRLPTASEALEGVTLNNLSIYYSRTAQPQRALRCLLRVLKTGRPTQQQVESGDAAEDNVAVHVALNMTTVLADLGRHREALEMAQQAVRTVTGVAASRGQEPEASLLCAAFHNLAVQQERHGLIHMNTYRQALLAAKRGRGGVDDPMAVFLAEAYQQAQRRAEAHAAVPGMGQLGPRPAMAAHARADTNAGSRPSSSRPSTAQSRRSSGCAAAPSRLRASSASCSRGGGVAKVTLSQIFEAPALAPRNLPDILGAATPNPSLSP